MRMSPLQDPLKAWPNEDLLLEEESHERLAKSCPELLRVLDWPDLRAAFKTQDARANRGKKWSRRQGLAAVFLSGFGVILLASAEVLNNADRNVINAVALAAMFCGGLLGVLHWGLLRSRHDWLGNRFWTERLRQLHFQGIANNLDLVARAMSEEASFDELKRLRADWFCEVYRDVDDPRDRMRAVLEDRIQENFWIFPEWARDPAPPAENADLMRLLEGLRRLRIGVQWTYSAKNLGDDVYSAPTRDRILRRVVSLAAIAVVFIAAAGLACLASGGTILGLGVVGWAFLSVALSAVGLMAQSINQGLQAQADTDRYQWYAEEIDDLRYDFERGDIVAKVTALRRLERASYIELRQFLRAHSAARFTS